MPRLYCLLFLGCLSLTACDDRKNRTTPNSPAKNPGSSGLTPTPNPSSKIGDATKKIPKLKKKDSSTLTAKLAALAGQEMRAVLKDWCVDDSDSEILTNMRIVDFDDYVVGSSAPRWAEAILGSSRDEREENLAELRGRAIKDFVPSGEVLLADFNKGCDRIETIMLDGLAAAYLQKINGQSNAPTCSKVPHRHYSDMYELEIKFPALSSLEEANSEDTEEKDPCPEDDSSSSVEANLWAGNTDGTLAMAFVRSYRDTQRPQHNTDSAFGSIIEEDGSTQFAKGSGMLRFLSINLPWDTPSETTSDSRSAPTEVRNDTLKSFATDWCGGALKNARVHNADDYLASNDVPTWYTPGHNDIVEGIKTWDHLREVVPNGDVVVADFDGGKTCRKHIVIIDALAAKNLQTISTKHSSNALTCSETEVSSREKYLHIGIPALDKVWEREEEQTCVGEDDYTLAYVLAGQIDGTVVLNSLRGKSEDNPSREVWKSYLFLMVEADGSVKFVKDDGALKLFHYEEYEEQKNEASSNQ